MNRGPWMGLHHAETSIDSADVLVVGVPYDSSVSHDPGAAEAPDVLRELARRATDPVHSRLPRLLGFDLVEVSPPADVNHITALAGMGILINTLGLIAVQRGLSRDVPRE